MKNDSSDMFDKSEVNRIVALIEKDFIWTRFACGTYIARWRGKTASCTSCAERAAQGVAEKILGNTEFDLVRMVVAGERQAWLVIERSHHGN